MTVVQQDWDFGLSLDSSYLSEGLDLYESLNLSPPEELWKTELESLSDAWNCQDDSWNDYKRGTALIRVHDCMWAGTCLSKDHVDRKPQQSSDKCLTSTTNNLTSINSSNLGSSNSCSSPIRIPNNKPIQRDRPLTSSRSFIIRKPTIPAPTKILLRPDTPQSEDETSKTPDDHDLSWSMGVAVSEITGQRRTETATIRTAATIANSVSFDHNYDTKKQPRIDDLGVVTPSDSEEDEEESEEDEECQTSEVENEEEDEEDDEEEEIDVVSLKPANPPRKKLTDKRMQEEWRRLENLRTDDWIKQEKLSAQEWRIELSRQEQTAVKFASQAVSKRLSVEATRGRGRQKRKRTSSDEEDNCKSETYVPEYKPNYRRSTPGRPRNTNRRKYDTPSKKTRISTDSETDSTEKRSQHNNMERKRRIDLRNAFEDLRSLVPSLADTQRAAKVTILRDAASYCLQLNSNSRTLQSQVSILRRQQEELRTNLSKLRRHIAHKHVGLSVR